MNKPRPKPCSNADALVKLAEANCRMVDLVLKFQKDVLDRALAVCDFGMRAKELEVEQSKARPEPIQPRNFKAPIMVPGEIGTRNGFDITVPDNGMDGPNG